MSGGVGHSMKDCSCAKCEHVRAYMREYGARPENRSRTRAWREAHRAEMSARRRERYRTDAEHRKELLARGKSPERREAQRTRKRQRYHADEAYRAKVLERSREWTRNPENREKQRSGNRQRRLKRIQTPEGWAQDRARQRTFDVTADEILDLLRRQGMRCAVTGYPLDFKNVDRHPLQPTLDHIVPRAEGGAGTIDNLRVILWAVNAARGSRRDCDGVVEALFRKWGEQLLLFDGMHRDAS